MSRSAELVVSLAVATLPRRVRARYREEWRADLDGAEENGVRPWGVAIGALLFSATLGRTAPEISGMPIAATVRRRARWGIALLGSAAVLGFGYVVLGGHSSAPVTPIELLLRAVAMILLLLACALAALGLIQVWRAALAASTLSVVSATLISAAVACVAAMAVIPTRTGPLALGLLVLLAAGGICGAIAVSSAPPPAGVDPAPRRKVSRATISIATVSLLVLVVLGSAELLVWGPLAHTEGDDLAAIYAGLSDLDRDYGVGMIVTWIVFWTLAVGAFAIVTGIVARRTGGVGIRTMWAIALALAAAIVFFQFWAGFSLGMSIADTLPPYRGGISPVGRLYALGGQIALVGVIFLVIAPRRMPEHGSREVGPTGIEPMTSTV